MEKINDGKFPKNDSGMETMQKKESIPILLIHLALLFFSQMVIILLIQSTIQFVVLQDRMPMDELADKNFEEITEIQKVKAVELTDDLKNNYGEVTKRYYEIIFTERHGVLFWSSLMWAVAFLVPAYFLLHSRMQVPISRLEDPFKVEMVGRGILGGATIFLLVTGVGILLNLVGLKPKNNEFQTMLLVNLKGNENLLAWSLYSVGLFTGIIEEWFFRGMLFRHYLSKGLVKEGWIVTSVLFGALHYSPEASFIIPALLSGVGMYFGFLYLKSGNIWVPITAHATYNSISLVLAYFIGDMVT